MAPPLPKKSRQSSLTSFFKPSLSTTSADEDSEKPASVVADGDAACGTGADATGALKWKFQYSTFSREERQ